MTTTEEKLDILTKILFGETGFCITCHQPCDEDDEECKADELFEVVSGELDNFDDRLRLLELRTGALSVKVDRMWAVFPSNPGHKRPVILGMPQKNSTTVPSAEEIREILFGTDERPEPRVFNPHSDFCDEPNCCGGGTCCE
jgi:hypothetical protein